MALAFTCPHCSRTLNIPEQYVGVRGRCRHCGRQITPQRQELAGATTVIPAPPAPPHPGAAGGDRGSPHGPAEHCAGGAPPAPLRHDAACCVLEDMAALDPKIHAARLAGPLGLSPYDAAVALRQARGILRVPAEGSPDAVRSALQDLGIACRFTWASRLVSPPMARRVREVEWSDDCMRATLGEGGETVELPWPDLDALVCGEIQEQPERRAPARDWGAMNDEAVVRQTRLDPSPRRALDARTTWLVDILWLRPLERVRLAAGHIDFAFLGERRTSNTRANLRLLAITVSALSPRLLTNLTPEDLRDDGRMGWHPPAFAGAHDFDATVRWLANRAAGRQEPSGQ